MIVGAVVFFFLFPSVLWFLIYRIDEECEPNILITVGKWVIQREL